LIAIFLSKLDRQLDKETGGICETLEIKKRDQHISFSLPKKK
jgi:hypothetical protein